MAAVEGFCRCGSRWTGENRSHCSACHNTFGGVTSFDSHRYGDIEKERKCRKPEKMGLNQNEHEIWVATYGE